MSIGIEDNENGTNQKQSDNSETVNSIHQSLENQKRNNFQVVLLEAGKQTRENGLETTQPITIQNLGGDNQILCLRVIQGRNEKFENLIRQARRKLGSDDDLLSCLLTAQQALTRVRYLNSNSS